MNRKLYEDARHCISEQDPGVLLWRGEEEPGSYHHRAGDSASKISRLYPTSRAVSKFCHFHSLAIQENEENNIFFQRRKKGKENMLQTLLCVFLT